LNYIQKKIQLQKKNKNFLSHQKRNFQKKKVSLQNKQIFNTKELTRKQLLPTLTEISTMPVVEDHLVEVESDLAKENPY
jgi:hypothetical protein